MLHKIPDHPRGRSADAAVKEREHHVWLRPAKVGGSDGPHQPSLLPSRSPSTTTPVHRRCRYPLGSSSTPSG
ncbi:hypothetical protein HBH77_011320 [Parastagonospora nodorum]|nr:hypothetical protein HBH77_011320 [Parastagonospora nodorum]